VRGGKPAGAQVRRSSNRGPLPSLLTRLRVAMQQPRSGSSDADK
jgi:hypothetical protein